MIDPNEVEQVLTDCLFREGEAQEPHVEVEGILNPFWFHPERLESHRQQVADWLSQLPHGFRLNEGGGWSFLEACMTEDGEQWTGLHQRMDQLFALGQGLGLVKTLLPREMWTALPGGMPYYAIDLGVTA